MHPKGDEVVCLLSGSLDFVLEMGREERRVSLEKAGQFVLVPKGIWHTAKVAEPSRLLFITAGEGTQHRPLAGT
jgi:quercetin dioxygenase-like cupin family protein